MARNGKDTIELRDVVGPYAGQIRTYLKHAGENAVASGFAEYVTEDEPEVEAVQEAESGLPHDFPGRPELEAVGIESLEDVPTDMAALKGIPGIGPATARKIVVEIRGA